MWVKKMALCEICGNEYIKAAPNSKCCSDKCKELMEKRLSEERKANKKANNKRKIMQERQDELNRILREAAAHGMSYGKYVAYLNERGNQCE